MVVWPLVSVSRRIDSGRGGSGGGERDRVFLTVVSAITISNLNIVTSASMISVPSSAL
jgi:hypothetical protein